jgi:hypothetical protein
MYSTDWSRNLWQTSYTGILNAVNENLVCTCCTLESCLAYVATNQTLTQRCISKPTQAFVVRL